MDSGSSDNARAARQLATRLSLEESLGVRYWAPTYWLDEAELPREPAAVAAIPPKTVARHDPRPEGAGEAPPSQPSPSGERSAAVAEPAAVSPAAAPRARSAPARSAPTAIAPPPEDWPEAMRALRAEALACQGCGLRATCRQVVFGEGACPADLVFVGEGPGRDEDEQGRPFVGAAGKMLTSMIEKGLGRPRASVFIANTIKCRPPGNRDPRPEETAVCRPWLERQIALLQPRVLVAVGRYAGAGLSGGEPVMKRLRGQWLDHQGIPLRVLYHPAYLLRERQRSGGNHSQADRETWEDLKAVLERLNA